MSSTSSTVCDQGSENTCLDQLVRLKLNPPTSNFPSNFESQKKISEIEKPTNNKEAGWNLVQSLTKKANETEQVYVHPLVKRSASLLSPKSLEMCTESLGNETGSENVGCHYIYSMFSQEKIDIINPTLTDFSKSNDDCVVQAAPKRLSRSHGSTAFPPPLTSISGSKGVQVTPHREDGRLVLKAVTVVSPPTSYFQAERGGGRLRLRLLADLSPDCNIEEEAEADDGEEERASEDDEAVEAVEDEAKMEGEIEENVFGVETEEVGENGETEEVDGNGGNVEDMDENSGNVGGEKGRGKLPRPSRCKEGGCGKKKMAMNWQESYWVAT